MTARLSMPGVSKQINCTIHKQPDSQQTAAAKYMELALAAVMI